MFVLLRWVLTELRQNLAKELDFRLEAANAQRLAAAFAGRRGVAVPLPVPEVGLPSNTDLNDVKTEHPQNLGNAPGALDWS